MEFLKARESNLSHEEKVDGPPVLLIHAAAFRETAYRRWRRQAWDPGPCGARDMQYDPAPPV
jgi:hypothetical protein